MAQEVGMRAREWEKGGDKLDEGMEAWPPSKGPRRNAHKKEAFFLFFFDDWYSPETEKNNARD